MGLLKGHSNLLYAQDDSENPSSRREEEEEDDKSILELSKSNETSRTGMTDEAKNKRHPDELAQRETRIVSLLRALVALILILCATAVCFAVYRYTSDQEQADFENDFASHANKVMEAVDSNLERQLSTLSNFGVTITSYAQDTNATWPFVTLPDYEQRIHSTVSEVNAIGLLFLVKVASQYRQEWDKYSVDNIAWAFEGVQYQRTGVYGGQSDVHPLVPPPASGPPSGSGPPPGVDTSSSSTGSGPPPGMTDTSSTSTGSDLGPPPGVSGPPDAAPGSLGGPPPNVERVDFSSGIADSIFTFGPFGPVKDTSPGPWWTQWQNAPAKVNYGIQNFNSASVGALPFQIAGEKQAASMGLSTNVKPPEGQPSPSDAAINDILKLWGYDGIAGTDPIGFLYHPVFDSLDKSNTAGVLILYLHWHRLFVNVLPSSARGIVAVVQSSCNETFSYRIDGLEVEYLGSGDYHDIQFEDMEKTTYLTRDFNEHKSRFYTGADLDDGYCNYVVRVYPSKDTEDEYKTSGPVIYTVGAVAIFVFTVLLLGLLDFFIERRQRLMMKNVVQSGKILSNLFPSSIKDQLMEEQEQPSRKRSYMSNNRRLQKFLRNDDDESFHENGMLQKPIANLFPHTTVMVSTNLESQLLLRTRDTMLTLLRKFADVANFTSWSSTRDAGQVFQFLQAIYQGFDSLARRRHVFKVETVGDCYVAVAGLPSPQDNHYVIMAKFAQECLFKFNEMTRQLEPMLGPDTGDLQIRIGLNSGPVTAGVLRGDKSRFQLFGDTVNMSARMQSLSLPNRIQLSKATAELLIAGGNQSWVTEREDEILVKGKGKVKTYFLVPRARYASSSFSGAKSVVNEFANKGISDISAQKKERRLVAWCVEQLSLHLKKIIARRQVLRVSKSHRFPTHLTLNSDTEHGRTALDEVQEVITMPSFNPDLTSKEANPESIVLDAKVVAQLENYVRTIASLYRDNPFHNFEHASHVAMGVDKLLSRVVTPDIIESKQSDIALDLHDYTFGITSDPLTHFAVVFSALIHDVDHRGISNQQMVKEEPHFGVLYKNKSVAEQNSIDLAWDLLMRDEYEDLRRCIYSTESELRRFRQVVLSVVLATDIFDKELNDLRKSRWAKAFSDDTEQPADDTSNLKATIVLEHMIQASDVSHTMQHWHVYRKWNQRLFRELSAAFQAGRMGADPATFWYKGELGFFDNYIIPLAKKLKDCGVFGVSSDEFLNYAKANREEWEAKGQQIVAEMVEDLRDKEMMDLGIVVEGDGEDLLLGDDSNHPPLRSKPVDS